MPRPGYVVVATLFAAIVVFCGVQDRVTAAGAERYVDLQRAAAAGKGKPVTVDEVMTPAIRRSLQLGGAWGGGVMAVGLAGAAAAGRWRRE